MIRVFPFLFVFLWASAFITSKIIVLDATAFASLAFRFALVAVGFFCFALYNRDKISASRRDILEACGIGILFHGLYLGGVFFAISKSMPAGLAALIVSLQPILTSALAGPLLGETVTWRQWVGVVFGFSGAAIVLGFDIGTEFPLIALAATIMGLLAVTAGTLWMKKVSGNLPLSVSNFYQSSAACLFHGAMIFIIETPSITFTPAFIWAMSWQICAVSFGAFTILMYLIKTGSASRTALLFFLVPPVSAVMAWLFLDEILTMIDIFGLMIATFGVYVATRPSQSDKT